MITSYNDLKIKDFKRVLNGDNPIEILTEKPLNEVLISEMNDFSSDFLNAPYEPKMPSKRYIFNGREYEVELNPNKMTVSQYLDFQTFVKDPNKYISNLLACFLLPKGEQYGESDPLENAKFLEENCSYAICQDINFFFLKLLEIYIHNTQESLGSRMKKLLKNEKDPTVRKQILRQIIKLKMSSND